MSSRVSYKCDTCEIELITESANPHKWGLVLDSMDFNVNNTGQQYAINMDPPIEEQKHFCGMRCLAEWAEQELQTERK